MATFLQGFGHRLLTSNAWRVIRVEQRDRPNPCAQRVWCDDKGAMVVSAIPAEQDHFIVQFTDLADFDIRFETREVRIFIAGDHVSEGAIDHLLADQIWPRIVAHSGRLVLHGAGVKLPEGALILIGRSGSGKSTLAASFHQAGFELLGDDAIVVSTRGQTASCRAVYPSLRLFPDTIETLFGRFGKHSPVAHYTNKRNIHLYDAPQPTAEVPILALLFLASAEDTLDITFRPLPTGQTCINIIEHSFWLNPKDMDRTKDKLRWASELTESVPALEVSYPHRFSDLPKLHAMLLTHFGVESGDVATTMHGEPE